MSSAMSSATATATPEPPALVSELHPDLHWMFELHLAGSNAATETLIRKLKLRQNRGHAFLCGDRCFWLDWSGYRPRIVDIRRSEPLPVA